MRQWLLTAVMTLGLAQAKGGLHVTSSLNCPLNSSPAKSVDCRWQVPAGTVRVVGDSPRYDIILSAYTQAGKLLWQEKKVSIIFGIQLLDGVLVIDTNSNGAGTMISSSTALISPKLNPPVWIWGSFIISRPSGHLALFTQEDVIRPEDSAGLAFQRVTLTPEIRVDPIHFDQPSRPSCGVAHGGWEAFGQPKFTQRYVYVVRQDSCGYFMTRFDWVTPQAKPLSYPIPAPH